MATITDNTYFEKGRLYIPNNTDISVAPVGVPSSQSDLDFFIDKYERELLLNALGVTLYDELQTQLPTPSIQKWIDLVDGKNYTINGKTKRWDGLKGYNKQSVIAYFIFTQYMRNDEQTYTTVGSVKNNAIGAEVVDMTPKYISAYTLFLEAYQGYCMDNVPKIIVNGSGNVGLDYYGQDNIQVSLYQYLTDSNTLDPTSFPDFEFKVYESQNSLGI